MQEIEAKFYVLDLDRIRMRLQSLEALLIQERVLETNIRFDLPDGGLRSEGRVLRLRQDTEAKLTYKGPSSTDQGVLSHTEIEFNVGDYDKAKAFIEALGYQKLFYYEKYRTTYELHQTSEVFVEHPRNGVEGAETSEVLHVMLDELPYGNFVEIEGEGVESIRAVANKLNLNWDTAAPISYHLLFTRLCAKHPELDPSDLSFSALKGLEISAEDLSIRAANG
ncbi:MAG: class IV adenylate cyclase [Anaerolineales bacterium]|nr:class IV adenylate cyclase [Anaerolineales bacterium]